MATTPNMGLVLPDDHTSLDTWGLALNIALGVNGNNVDGHDHSPGKGVLVPSSGIGINADLSFATFALTTAKAITFNPVSTTAVTGYANALFVDSTGLNLYFRNNSGTNVQLTNGGTINMSLIGGIGGDYASVSALVQYNDSSKDYLLQQEGSPRPWAGLETGDIKLFQKAASIANAVTLKSPSALAASYTVTWPAAVPAAGALLQMATDGTLTATNVLALNQNLKLQGTGYLQRGNGQHVHPFTPLNNWQVTTGSPPAWKSAGNSAAVTVAASTTAYYPLEIGTDKDQLQAVVVYCRALVGAATLSLYRSTGMGTGVTSIGPVTLSGGGTTLSVPADGLTNPRTLTVQSPSVLTAGEVYLLRVDTTVGNTLDLASYGAVTDVP